MPITGSIQEGARREEQLQEKNFKSERLAKTRNELELWQHQCERKDSRELDYSADIVCLQETQMEKLNEPDFNITSTTMAMDNLSLDRKE